jgi:hypothetical protein
MYKDVFVDILFGVTMHPARVSADLLFVTKHHRHEDHSDASSLDQEDIKWK